MKILKEQIIEIPDVINVVDVDELTPEGPELGEDTGIANLILDSIATTTEKIQELNTLNANINNREDLKEILTDIMAEENSILGKLQSMLKMVSPNAVEIMNGAVEAEETVDDDFLFDTPNELDESFNEYLNNLRGSIYDKLNESTEEEVKIDDDFGYSFSLNEYMKATKGDEEDKAETDALNNEYSGPVKYKDYIIKSNDNGQSYRVFKGNHLIKSGIDTFIRAKEYINSL